MLSAVSPIKVTSDYVGLTIRRIEWTENPVRRTLLLASRGSVDKPRVTEPISPDADLSTGREGVRQRHPKPTSPTCETVRPRVDARIGPSAPTIAGGLPME